MRIRPLEQGDRDALFGPRLRYAAAQWLDRQRRGEVYVAVAEIDDVAVGRVGLDFTAFGEPGVVLLWAASVGEEWRGRGVGTALMRHLEDVALERGCSTVELLVAQDNDAAMRLYGGLGYEICGQGVNRWVEKSGEVAEELEELCWRMRKRLADE